MVEKYGGKKKCVQDLISDVRKEQVAIQAKSRDIHNRAAEMTAEGHKRMSKGIDAVVAGISLKSKEIHNRAEDMIAEGNKRMSIGIAACKNGINEQVKKNNAYAKEMDNKIKHFNNKVERYGNEIKAHSEATARYAHIFYYGEGKS